MKKSSGAVMLVLISSALLPLGCSRECKQKLPNGRPNPNCSGSHHSVGSHGIVHGAPGTSTTTTGTSRGGFGSSAGAHASGGS